MKHVTYIGGGLYKNDSAHSKDQSEDHSRGIGSLAQHPQKEYPAQWTSEETYHLHKSIPQRNNIGIGHDQGKRGTQTPQCDCE